MKNLTHMNKQTPLTQCLRSHLRIGQFPTGSQQYNIYSAAADEIEFYYSQMLKWKAIAESNNAAVQELTPMGDKNNEWYFDCDGHYIDVKRDENGKYSVFFRNRKDNDDAFYDQDAKMWSQDPKMWTENIMKALTDARQLAMNQAANAPVPECGDFAAIAQNLDWVLNNIHNCNFERKVK